MARPLSATKMRNLLKRNAALAAWYHAFPDVPQTTVRSARADAKAKIAKAARRQKIIRAIKEALRKIKGSRDYGSARHISLASIREKIKKNARTHNLSAQDIEYLSVRTLGRLFHSIGVLPRDRKVPYTGDVVVNTGITGVQMKALEFCRNIHGW